MSDKTTIEQEVKKIVYEVVQLNRCNGDIKSADDIRLEFELDNLAFDSLDRIEIIMEVEAGIGIEIDEDEIKTVGDLVKAAGGAA